MPVLVSVVDRHPSGRRHGSSGSFFTTFAGFGSAVADPALMTQLSTRDSGSALAGEGVLSVEDIFGAGDLLRSLPSSGLMKVCGAATHSEADDASDGGFACADDVSDTVVLGCPTTIPSTNL